MKLWREHSGFVAWPTLVITVVLVLLTGMVWSACLWAGLPLWLGTIAQTLIVYVSFTPMHEAAHGNVGGKSAYGSVDRVVGWVCSMLFLAPFPVFKALHLRHHGTVNRVDADPDLWVAGTNRLSVVLRCFSILPHYYFVFIIRMAWQSPKMRRARNEAAVGLLVLGVLIGGLVLNGLWLEVFFLAFVPAFLASGCLAFVFDYLPHHPHQNTGRFTNARILLWPGLTFLMLYQNYHLIHHLWPRVPWYRYASLFRAVRTELVEEGSEIQGWSA